MIVCDGFAGNAVLKASEGLAGMLVERVQLAFSSRLRGRLASWIAKPVLKHLKQELDPVRYNGASLLSLQGIVVKSHGGTQAEGFTMPFAAPCRRSSTACPSGLPSAGPFMGSVYLS